MANEAARLDQAVRAVVGTALIGVSIGNISNKSTWKVLPASLQAAAQPTIDAFDPAAPAVVTAELDAQVQAALDNERIYSAIVWAVIDTYSAPATKPKFAAARAKITAAFTAQPWK
jgi:hypothetical protein